MLSIGKVGAGQASPSYYVESVAQGAEDYYAGTGEAQGQWHGKGATARGLTGTVKEGDFLKTLKSNPAQGKTVLGYDLTFSAPKSVSLLYGLGEPELAGMVRDAHDEAVRQALDYLEDDALFTRRGKGGQRVLKGDGMTVANFRHRTSRAGDPQLHTHAVVANATQAENETSTVYGQALYAHARTAGYLYQAALRAQLTEHIGVEWKPVRHGMAEIEGFDEAVLRHFSQRRQDIEQRLAERGGRSMTAARIATLDTRRAKDYDRPLGELRAQWAARAAEHGLDQDQLSSVLDRRMSGRPVEPDIMQAAESMAAAGGITHHASTFDRRDVLRDWASAHREGATVKRLERLSDRWLASDNAVRLEDSDRRLHLGGPRHSTPDMLATERELVERSVARLDSGTALGSARAVEQLTPASGLSHEQRHLVAEVTLSGHGVQVVRAAAGTGKTRALHIARRVWEANDVPVFGCALAARAAVELEALAGIDSTTVAHLERDLDQGYGVPRGAVLVVDEAGMVGTRSLARLANHCAATSSKLLLVGDDRQLPEIDAGGAFRRLATDLGTTELRTVWRQNEAWDREALDDLRRGKVADFANQYRDHGRLAAEPTADGARKRLVTDWWHGARQPHTDAVMIAHRRADVAELNALGRSLMLEDRRLGEDEVQAADGRAFAVGDRVLAKRNDRRLDIVNGSRAEVIAVDQAHRSLDVRLSDGTTRSIDSAYLDRGLLHHGYALTAHAAQGATVDRAYVLGSDDLYREWGYTAMTRHRNEARFYVVSPGSVERALPGLEPQPDPVTEEVVAMLGRSGRKTAAVDVLERGGAPARARAARAANAAHERAAQLQADVEKTHPWQRSKRSRLSTEMAAQNRAASSLAAAQAEPVVTSRPDLSCPNVEAIRACVLMPDEARDIVIGARPRGLAGRDAWTAAAAAVTGRTRSRTLPERHLEPPSDAHDIGL